MATGVQVRPFKVNVEVNPKPLNIITDGPNYPEENNQIKASIELTRKNEAEVNYQFDADLKVPYVEPVHATGKLLLSGQEAHLLLEWRANGQVYIQ